MKATLCNITVANSSNKSMVTLTFNKKPMYDFCVLHNPERIVVDISQCCPMYQLPCYLHNDNVIKRISTSTQLDKQKSLRLVLELHRQLRTKAVMKQFSRRYNLVLTVTNPPQLAGASLHSIYRQSSPPKLATNQFNNLMISIKKTAATPILTQHFLLPVDNEPVVVAIDAGHGGQDPGATGPYGLHEKNVTIAIARKLKKLLDNDQMFKPILTRDGNYCISVMGRSDVARKNGARVLISLHADAAPNSSVSGASVWLLSNRRAKNEMANWLEQHEKQSELLGLAGYLLANSQADPYLSQAVLDLQFGHSQQVGYDIAVKVLSQLNRIGTLHKHLPEYASLGVLRSPDIPSLLVETGFISNTHEERLLGSSAYQDKIAKAIHLGLRSYFIMHPIRTSPKFKDRQWLVKSVVDVRAIQNAMLACSDTVVYGEKLFGIARQYGISMN